MSHRSLSDANRISRVLAKKKAFRWMPGMRDAQTGMRAEEPLNGPILNAIRNGVAHPDIDDDQTAHLILGQIPSDIDVTYRRRSGLHEVELRDRNMNHTMASGSDLGYVAAIALIAALTDGRNESR